MKTTNLLSRSLVLSIAVWLGGSDTLLASPEISLVSDIAKGRDLDPSGGDGLPSEEVLAVAGGLSVFASNRGEAGAELWVTDGTAAGTKQVSDLCLGPCRYRLQLLGTNGRQAFFWVDSFTNPAVRGLWATDGTRPGTRLLKRFDIRAEPFQYAGALPGSDLHYFALCDPQCALWRTDASLPGTRRVAALGGGGVRVGQALVAGQRVFVTVFGATADAAAALWVSDGQAAGTRVASPIRPSRADLATVGSRVYFPGEDERLWRSDGTAAGTIRLHPGVSPSGSWSLVGAGVCFPGYQAQTGWDLWCSDGTVATTRAWTQFDYFEAVREEFGETFRVVEYRKRRYFFAADGLTERTLWSTDGSPQGAKPFNTSCSSCPESIYWFATVGSKLVIEGYSPDSSESLFLSDGTPQGTEPFEVCACEVSAYGVSGPYLFVIAEQGDRRELYRTDGTPNGTVRLLRSGSVDAQFSVSFRGGGSWWLRGLGLGLSRLALSDGTVQGTRDLLPRQGTRERSSNPFPALALGDGAFFCADPTGASQFHSRVWFTAGPGSATRLADECSFALRATTNRFGFWAESFYGNLTRSDGTVGGTAVLVPERSFDSFNGLATLGEQVGFVVSEHDDTFSLHRSDATVSGTVRVAQVPAEPFYLSNTGDSVYFFTAGQLWRSDLTAAGTVSVRSDVDDALVGPLTRYGPLLLVEGVFQYSWLRVDGSTALAPLVSDPSLFYNHHLVVHGHWAYFWGQSSASNTRWRLARLDLDQLAATGNATPEILAGFDRPTEAYRGSSDGDLVALDDGRMAFTARDKKFGEELFISDGTSSGTRRVSDVYPGPTGGVFSDPVSLGGGVVFAAHDGEHGVELWWSDGTSSGTRLIEDLRPGIESSSPDGFLAADGRVYFAADDGKIGREVWVVEP